MFIYIRIRLQLVFKPTSENRTSLFLPELGKLRLSVQNTLIKNVYTYLTELPMSGFRHEKRAQQ